MVRGFIFMMVIHRRRLSYFNPVADMPIGLVMIWYYFDMNRPMQCIKKQSETIQGQTLYYFMMSHGHNFNLGNKNEIKTNKKD